MDELVVLYSRLSEEGFRFRSHGGKEEVVEVEEKERSKLRRGEDLERVSHGWLQPWPLSSFSNFVGKTQTTTQSRNRGL